MLRLRMGNSVAFEQPGIQVGPSTQVDLAPIDLSQAPVSLSFDVRDTSGRLLYSPLASIFVGGEYAASSNARKGHVTLDYLPTGEPVLLVQYGDYVPKLVEPTPALQTVVLERGIKVHLLTNQRPALESGGSVASLSLSRAAGDPRLGDERFSGSIPEALAVDGMADVVLPGPGTYRLEVSFTEEMTGGMMSVSMSKPLPGDFTLEIRATDAGNSFEVVLPENLFE